MHRRFRRYIFRLFLATAVLLAALATLNVVVDPFGAYRIVAADRLEPYKNLGNRIAKAELLRHEGADAIIVGSSRVQIGFDPLSPHWQTLTRRRTALDAEGGRSDAPIRVQNLGLPLLDAYEARSIVEYAIAQGSIRDITLCVELDQVRPGPPASVPDFTLSRFNPEKRAVAYHFEQLISMHTTASSFEVLRSLLARRPTGRDGRGLFEPTSWDSIPIMERIDRVLWRSLTRDYPLFGLSTERLADIAEIMKLCRAKGVTLRILFLPLHALQLSAIDAAGLWEDFEAMQRHIVAMAEDPAIGSGEFDVWDFTSFRGFCADPVPTDGNSMKWYWESSHFRKAVGELVLARILGESAPKTPDGEDFGIRLSSSLTATRHEALRRERDAWLRANGPLVETLIRPYIRPRGRMALPAQG